MFAIGSLYEPLQKTDPYRQAIPERQNVLQYTQFSNYNYRVTTIPNCVIGRRHNIPERNNNDGAFQPPGVPLAHFGKKDDSVMHNLAGYVKPSYTKYG
jgi:hypothetical protein